jgi:hypothetical protein
MSEIFGETRLSTWSKVCADTLEDARTMPGVSDSYGSVADHDLKHRILQESAERRPKVPKRNARPWSLRPPGPGTAVWDLRNKFEEVAVIEAKRKIPATMETSSNGGSSSSRVTSSSVASESPGADHDPLRDELERLHSDAALRSRSKSVRSPTSCDADESSELERYLYLQPETRPISQEQLVNEVKGKYQSGTCVM